MVLDLNFSRYDNTTPFGFKLVGGADFDVPLTVVKILPGSIAEDVGMHMGDVVVRINDIPTGNMSYYDAHQLLACAGNQFVLGILRAREVTPSQRLIKEKTPSGEVEYINTSPKPFWTPNVGSPSPLAVHHPAKEEPRQQQQPDEQIPEIPITDEQIAEILSGEAEVLKQHNVIGVNFNKMIPKAGVFKQSEVFKTLNSELVQSEEEDKKWTTFLQKPSRPPPKTPEERKLERNPPTERYQVRIVKQPKPKIAPDYKPPKSPEPEPEPEPIPMYDEYLNERQEVEVETIKTLVEEPVVPSEPMAGNHHLEHPVGPCCPCPYACPGDNVGCCGEEELETNTNANGTSTAGEGEAQQPGAPNPTEEEPSEEFREQLQNVQKQLEALSALPNTIQATIAALTEQLAVLAAPKRKSKSISPRPEEADPSAGGEGTEQSAPEAIVPEVSETFEVTEFSRADSSGSGDQSSSVDEGEHIHYTEEELEQLEKRMKEHDIEWTNQNDKDSDSSSQHNAGGDIRTAVQDELKLQVVKKKKKAVSAFGPLTPQERPIYLPGGRKWRTAKDAFNEQFIAEVISSQAELIQGTTLGNFYESPHLGYDDRVNFLKYQKPEKDLSFIKNSDVYKLVHDMDPPKSGIELRPEMVVAEEDVRKVMKDETIFQPRKSKVFLYQN
ncbi:proteoglycan 4 isoform X1 [Anopheles arabiensis]|uniref:proteoglycan 4 isoform X1 n=1 Tax=Anopheles arabiensis TaxID=7173 RepID=UPI001AACFD73|nr:proteoglycan 4 isoform X1 [Anopheles arabiensis]